MRYWQVASEAEVARGLGVSARMVCYYLRRAYTRLRAIVEQSAAEVRAGKQPRISWSLTRYPAHAEALADFAAALLSGKTGTTLVR
jgi:hypothetical protein